MEQTLSKTHNTDNTYFAVDALVLFDLQNPLLRLQNVACKHTNGKRQKRQNRLGDKFPAGRPRITANLAPLCPKAVPDWAVD